MKTFWIIWCCLSGSVMIIDLFIYLINLSYDDVTPESIKSMKRIFIISFIATVITSFFVCIIK